jgi:hypothetical protein
MKYFLLTIHFASLSTLYAAENQWVSLFNGKDLTGWTPKIRGYESGENYKNTFRVEDGVLKVSYDEYETWSGQYGHLFFEKKFSHYKIRLEYRFTGSQLKGGPAWALRNSGMMIHSESPTTMEVTQDFPASLEVQLLGGNGSEERSTANLCTPGTHVIIDEKLRTEHCIVSESRTYHGEQWVSVEIEVHANEKIIHRVNGTEVMTYGRPELGGDSHADALAEAAGTKAVSEGYICLQSESHPVEFKKIEIMELNP